MTEILFMRGWEALIGLLATIVLVLTPLGLMLRLMTPVEAMKHVGAMLGIFIALLLIPCILMNAWSSMSVSQQFGLVVMALALWLWLRLPRKKRRNRRE